MKKASLAHIYSLLSGGTIAHGFRSLLSRASNTKAHGLAANGSARYSALLSTKSNEDLNTYVRRAHGLRLSLRLFFTNVPSCRTHPRVCSTNPQCAPPSPTEPS